MSDELQNPPVIDLDQILNPISGEAPSGEDVKYAGIYDQIREARRADDVLDQGDWKTDVKFANYQLVVDLAVPALTMTSKDLQLSVWLGEALIRMHGFAGLRDSLKLLGKLQETFWDTMFPEVEEGGDQEARANALAWADREFATSAQFAPITGSSNFTFRDWQTAQSLVLPHNYDSLGSAEQEAARNEIAKADAEGKVTTDKWTRDVMATRRAQIEATNLVIEECWTAFADLNRVIDEKFDRNQAPSLDGFRKGLDDIHSQVKKILEQKRAEEPDISDLEDFAEGEGESGTSGGGGGRGGAINTRKDALARLGEIALFFQATEPHSPVSYLVQRAVKWGNMPLDSWLQEVIKDESVLYNLCETLGVTGQQGDG